MARDTIRAWAIRTIIKLPTRRGNSEYLIPVDINAVKTLPTRSARPNIDSPLSIRVDQVHRLSIHRYRQTRPILPVSLTRRQRCHDSHRRGHNPEMLPRRGLSPSRSAASIHRHKSECCLVRALRPCRRPPRRDLEPLGVGGRHRHSRLRAVTPRPPVVLK